MVLAVLLIVFAKFVMPKFNKAMDERAKKIKGQIEDAAARKRDAQKLKEEDEGLLGSAKDEAEKIRQEAEADLEAQKAKALSDLSSQVGRMAASMAFKILGSELKDPAARERMADCAVSRIVSGEEK